jgi:hypothetical protein
MSTPAYYRAEAERCRSMATRMPDSSSVKRWLQLALEYEQLAENMAGMAHIAGTPQAQHVSMQQQQLRAQEPRKPDADEQQSES